MNLQKLRVAGMAALFCLTASTAFSQSDPLSASIPDPDRTIFVIGSADFPESQILATLYSKALAARGIKVELRPNIGSREVYFPALKDGSIDLMPEYGGAALRYLDKNSTESATNDVLVALKKVLPDGLSLLAVSPAEDTNTVAVTRATADKNKLTSIGDLRAYAKDWVLGGPPEWKVRPEGVPGFEKVYGVTFKSYKTLDVCGPLVVSSLINGQIDVGCIFSTDPAIKDHDLVTLADPESLIPSQNIVPLISSAKVTKDIAATLDAVSASLTTDDLIAMNGRAKAHDSYDAIAEDWLKARKLN